MSYQPLLMSGIILGKSSGSLAVGSPVTGADPNAILTTDSAGKLSDKVLTSGQILIGSTGAAPVPATLSGTVNQVSISSGAGSITLSLPQDIGTSSNVTFGSVALQPSGSVDTTSTGTLAIGTSNANVINIGNSGATVNIQGTVLYENVTQLQVADPLITLNKGAGAGSASGSGVEIEEAGVITAFSKTSADRLSYTLKAPATAGIATITPGSAGITLNQSSHDPVTLGTPSGLSLSSQVLSLAVATSTVTGALSSTDWSTFNNKQPAGSYITALNGDGTASGPGSVAFTLATVNSTPGTTGSASSTSTITTNAKGLVTANTSTPIQIAESQVTNLVSDLAGKQPVGNYVTSITGDATGSGPGATAITLATVNASPGTSGSASTTSTITTNAKGLVTSNSSTPIQIAESQVTNLVSDLAGKQAAGNYITALSGDVTAAGPGSAAATLATVNLSPGTFGSVSSVNTIVVNGKGLVTAVTNSPIQIAEAQVTNLVSDLAGKQPTGNYLTSLTGDVTASGPGAGAATLATVNASPGTFGSVSSVNTVTVNAKGLVTSVTNAPIQIAESQVTNLVSDLAGKQPTGNYITALTGDATATGPGSVGITLATVNGNVGTFNNVTVNAKGLVTAASNVSYATAVTGDINPGSYSGLTNNTANQPITGLSFANSVSTFEALLNVQIVATANTYTTIRIFGTNRGTWASGDISAQFMGDSIPGLALSITSGGVVTISIGSVTGFTSGTVKYRAISLS